jgi:LEA14-like dessication related protein
MSRTGWAILIVGLGLLGVGGIIYYYQWQIKQLSNLTYQVTTISIGQLSASQTTINFNLRITSGSTLDAQVTGLSIDVYLNGQQVGTLTNTQPFVIPAMDYSDAPLSITVNPGQLLTDFETLLMNLAGGQDLPVVLNGFVNIKEAFLSFSIPFTVTTSVKQILNIS